MQAMKAPKCVGQNGMRKGRQGDHRQLPAPELPQPRRGRHHALQARIGLPDLVVERQGGHGGPQAAVYALEQRKADALLHACQFAADRGLRGAQELGGPRNAARDHHRPEHFNMPMRQHAAPHIRNEWIFNI
ncbi:hypothetical protein D3C72_1447790 [compost metagenome]